MSNLDPTYKLMRGAETVMIGRQPDCMAFLTRAVGSQTTVGELQAQGWRIVPAKPSPLSAALLAVSGWAS